MTNRNRPILTAIVERLSLLAVAVAFAVGLGSPSSAQAAAITQLEYVQWLVQLSGDTDQFTDNSTPGDYAAWARGKGMEPRGGWQLGSKLDKDALAQTLVQFLQLSPAKKGDYLRTLAASGIQLPSGPVVSRRDLANFVDSDLQPRASIFRRPKSPQKPDRDRDKDKDKDRDNRPSPGDRDNDRNGGGGDRDNDKGSGRGPSNGRK